MFASKIGTTIHKTVFIIIIRSYKVRAILGKYCKPRSSMLPIIEPFPSNLLIYNHLVTGWWLYLLLWKIWISWDYEIANWMEKQTCSKPPTRLLLGILWNSVHFMGWFPISPLGPPGYSGSWPGWCLFSGCVAVPKRTYKSWKASWTLWNYEVNLIFVDI